MIHNFTPVQAATGGLLIGLSAALMMLLKGRIAGISGIIGGLLHPSQGDTSWRVLFLAGMMLAPFLWTLGGGALPTASALVSDRLLILGGLLVGFGTRLGSGCTSGHGVCGLARRSPRSLAATLTFITAGMFSVWLLRHVFVGAASIGGAP